MSIAYWVSLMGFDALMIAAPVFAFGLVAFGFLGMGPVTIAVDSYGPVTDNAQSVFELSVIERLPGIKDEIKRDYGFTPDFADREASARGERRRRQYLQGHGEAGADWHRGRRLDDDDLFDRRAADRGSHGERRAVCRFFTRRSCWGSSRAARSSTGSPARRRRR